jgi:ferredoxin
MTFQVTVTPSGRQFSCDADETVINAALRAGIILPYGCKNGACGSCKGKAEHWSLNTAIISNAPSAKTKQHKACRCSAAPNRYRISPSKRVKWSPA